MLTLKHLRALRHFSVLIEHHHSNLPHHTERHAHIINVMLPHQHD